MTRAFYPALAMGRACCLAFILAVYFCGRLHGPRKKDTETARRGQEFFLDGDGARIPPSEEKIRQPLARAWLLLLGEVISDNLEHLTSCDATTTPKTSAIAVSKTTPQ
ncbi:hypothetical protein B0H19DRAFT_412223 [Mycena capillaripes]|nr:hypothetical protein B0H19DRAFT_412223 [Mycena capillaripes]